MNNEWLIILHLSNTLEFGLAVEITMVMDTLSTLGIARYIRESTLKSYEWQTLIVLMLKLQLLFLKSIYVDYDCIAV